ncbi:unnamed protein product [Echinostoma caproni]|uniref:Vegetative cell wall protein gp1-like n=1 Tax=Echinostoma caproni TaxID=27848 RepID=A0A183AW63_9TREM|nr:unnamed protein product [Echinostoma caproni]
MDDRPLSSRGAYNINWDEIDENSDPFTSKASGKSFAKSPKPAPPPRSPAKVTSKGDGPTPDQPQPPTSDNPPPQPKSPIQPKVTQSPDQTETANPPTEPETVRSPAKSKPVEVPNEQKTDESSIQSKSPAKVKPKPPVRKPVSARVPNGQPMKGPNESKQSDTDSDEFPKPCKSEFLFRKGVSCVMKHFVTQIVFLGFLHYFN